MKCFAYIRVSTDEQAKHGYSIAAQQEKLEAYGISQGWEIVEYFIDDGYSAKDLERPHFQRMLKRIKDEDIDVLVVYKLDRLTRSVTDLYEILKILDDNDCMFKSATEVYDTTNAIGRLFITLVAAIAQWERENTAERVRMGMEKKTKLGYWKGGMTPFGYFSEGNHLYTDDNEAEIVKKIYHLAKTTGFYTIAKQLTAAGYPTKKGGDWHVDTVRDIANNPIYAGYLTFNINKKDSSKPPREQNLYEGRHDPIISREEFWALQDILDRRRTFGGKRETSNYYFSSLLKCARCGSSMSGHKSPSGKTYRCSGKKAGKNCTSHIIKEDTLVQKVLESFEELTKGITGNTEINDVSIERIHELENELKLTQKLLKKKKVMYENDVIDIDELIKETESLREQEKKINNELSTYIQSKKNNVDELAFISENILSLWEAADDFERKEIMNTIFTQLVIDTVDDYKRGTGIPREIVILSVK